MSPFCWTPMDCVAIWLLYTRPALANRTWRVLFSTACSNKEQLFWYLIQTRTTFSYANRQGRKNAPIIVPIKRLLPTIFSFTGFQALKADAFRTRLLVRSVPLPRALQTWITMRLPTLQASQSEPRTSARRLNGPVNDYKEKARIIVPTSSS